MQLHRILLSAEFVPEYFLWQGSPAKFTLKDSTKENTIFTSSSLKSTVLVLPGSCLSTEQPQISSLLPLEPSSGRGRCRRANCDLNSNWLAVLVTGNSANSTQPDKPQAGKVGGRKASLTLCFLKSADTN